MSLYVETGGKPIVVRLTEESLHGPDHQETWEKLLRLAGKGKLFLDFARVESLTGAALGKLIALQKKAQGTGGKLILVNLPARLYEIFDITRLTRLFDIHPERIPA